MCFGGSMTCSAFRRDICKVSPKIRQSLRTHRCVGISLDLCQIGRALTWVPPRNDLLLSDRRKIGFQKDVRIEKKWVFAYLRVCASADTSGSDYLTSQWFWLCNEGAIIITLTLSHPLIWIVLTSLFGVAKQSGGIIGDHPIVDGLKIGLKIFKTSNSILILSMYTPDWPRLIYTNQAFLLCTLASSESGNQINVAVAAEVFLWRRWPDVVRQRRAWQQGPISIQDQKRGRKRLMRATHNQRRKRKILADILRQKMESSSSLSMPVCNNVLDSA